MTDEQREINHICSLIEGLSEKYHTHPDKVARVYGAMHEIDAEMMCRMKKIREGENNDIKC